MEATATFLDSVCRKTKLCKYYLAGRCTKGEDCNFAHGDAEVQAAPDLSCTKMCAELFRSGVCNDADCKFAHQKDDLRKIRLQFIRKGPLAQEPNHMGPPGFYSCRIGTVPASSYESRSISRQSMNEDYSLQCMPLSRYSEAWMDDSGAGGYGVPPDRTSKSPVNFSKVDSKPVQEVLPILDQGFTFYKTALCMFHQRGKCKKGSKCSFSHSLEDLREVPDLYRTKLCIPFLKNGCCRDNCRYAHGQEELRAPSRLPLYAGQPAAADNDDSKPSAQDKRVESYFGAQGAATPIDQRAVPLVAMWAAPGLPNTSDTLPGWAATSLPIKGGLGMEASAGYAPMESAEGPHFTPKLTTPPQALTTTSEDATRMESEEGPHCMPKLRTRPQALTTTGKAATPMESEEGTRFMPKLRTRPQALTMMSEATERPDLCSPTEEPEELAPLGRLAPAERQHTEELAPLERLVPEQRQQTWPLGELSCVRVKNTFLTTEAPLPLLSLPPKALSHPNLTLLDTDPEPKDQLCAPRTGEEACSPAVFESTPSSTQSGSPTSALSWPQGHLI